MSASKRQRVLRSETKTADPNVTINNPLAVLSMLAISETPDAKKPEENGKEINLVVTPDRMKLSNVSAMRSMFSPGRTFRIRTIRAASLTSGGGGTLLLATSIAMSGMSQYSALSSLFDECRLRGTRITYTFHAPVGGPNSFVSSFSPTNAASAPSSATAAFEIPGAKVFNTWNTLSLPGSHSNTWVPKQARPWSSTTASVTGVDPVGGMLGSWYHALFSTVTGAVVVADYFIECDYEFRNPI